MAPALFGPADRSTISAIRRRSSSSCASTALADPGACWAAARPARSPKTRASRSQLPPRALAPWTPVAAHPPVAFEVSEIEGDELGTSAHDFFFRSSGHDVARRSLAEGRCILQRESLPAAVDQVPSQPEERLRQDHPASLDPERMELD